MSCSHKTLYVIIPAAGSGTRMHSDKNKLLLEVDGIPVIDRTVAAFKRFSEESGYVIQAVLVVQPGMTEQWQEYIKDRPAFSVIRKITEGGDTRTASVNNGVHALDTGSDPDAPVFIHDAARCLIDHDTLSRCLDTITRDNVDVCVAGVKLKNTIKKISVKDGTVTVESTPPRELFYEVQTPQCFKYSCLRRCYDDASKEGFEATDDTALAEHFGYEVIIVEGSYSNIKITTPEDIDIAEAIIGH